MIFVLIQIPDSAILALTNVQLPGYANSASFQAAAFASSIRHLDFVAFEHKTGKLDNR